MKNPKQIITENDKERTISIPKYENSIMKIFDDSFMTTYRINDEEYDYICEKASDEDLDILARSHKTFGEIREAYRIRNKYLEQMSKENSVPGFIMSEEEWFNLSKEEQGKVIGDYNKNVKNDKNDKK